MKVTYEVIKIKAQKHIKCAICRTWITRSTTFMQTLNPFNKKADGNVKSREEIMAELNVRRNQWIQLDEKYYCKNCEGKQHERKP